MRTRVITGILLALSVSLSIIFLPVSWLKLVILALVAIGSYECAVMLLPRDPSSSYILPTALGVLLSIFFMFGAQNSTLVFVFVPSILFLSFIFYLFRGSPTKLRVPQITGTVFIVFYFAFLFSYLGLLRDLPSGKAWMFLVLAMTFSADTGGFFAGKFLGKHLLAPKISPKKTIEGLVGGVALSTTVGFIIKYLIFKEFLLVDILAVGLVTGLWGPLGDLAESLLKRSVGVKDSGKLIPGHGGLLDRVDALLFNVPMVYCYILYLRNFIS